MKNIPMSIRLLLSLFLAATLSNTNAQSTDNPLFRHIPTDADQVIRINIQSLMSKADWMSLMSKMKGSIPMGKDNSMSMFMDIMNSGIDISHDVIIAQKSSLNADSPSYTTILVHLSDSGKFVALIKKNQSDIHIHHLGKDHFMANAKLACAWDDKLAVFVSHKAAKGKSADPEAAVKFPPVLGRKAVTALHGFDHSIYTSDMNFTTGFSDDADVQMWNNSSLGFNALAKMLQKTPGAGAAQIDEFTKMMKNAKKSHTISSLRFEKGRLVFHSGRFLTSDDSIMVAHYVNRSLNTQILASLPPGNLLGMVTLTFSLDGAAEMMTKLNVMQRVDSMLQAKHNNFTTQDILHAFKGDFFLFAYPSEDPSVKSPLLYGVASIGDRSSFDKIAALLKQPGSADADTIKHKMRPQFAIQNDVVAISGTQAHADGFFKHPAATTDPAGRLLTDQVRSNPMNIAVDIRATSDFLAKALAKNDSLPPKMQMILGLVRNFDTFTFSSGRLHDNKVETTVELKFADANKNSLASLIDIIMSATGGK